MTSDLLRRSLIYYSRTAPLRANYIFNSIMNLSYGLGQTTLYTLSHPRHVHSQVADFFPLSANRRHIVYIEQHSRALHQIAVVASAKQRILLSCLERAISVERNAANNKYKCLLHPRANSMLVHAARESATRKDERNSAKSSSEAKTNASQLKLLRPGPESLSKPGDPQANASMSEVHHWATERN